MFKKYGHRKSRLDEQTGDWVNGFWWNGIFEKLFEKSGIKYSASITLNTKVYVPFQENIVRDFRLKMESK
jgi:hypothetical protein